MQRRSFSLLALILAPMFATSAVAIADGPATPAPTPANAEAIARGGYLVRFGMCNDCHTPWKMGPNGPVTVASSHTEVTCNDGVSRCSL